MATSTKWFLLGIFLATVSAQAEVEEEGKISLGSEIYLSNNVGASTFSKQYQQAPLVATNVFVYPYVKVGPFWGDRELKIHGEVSSAFEWMGEKNPFPGHMGNKFSFGDAKLRFELKKAVNLSDIGFSLAPALKLEAPLSKSSRVANRVLGLGGYVIAKWSKWGFFVSYKPIVLGYVHSNPFKSDSCSEESLAEDKLANGSCKVAGRQAAMLIKNGVYVGYEYGKNTVTLVFKTYHSFLKPEGRGEKPEVVKSSGIMESSVAYLEYSYEFPLTFPTTLTLGVSGYQAPYDQKEDFRLPFFSFAEASKNLTEVYGAINIAI